MPQSRLSTRHRELSFHRSKYSEPCEKHRSAILSGIDEEMYRQSPFRPITLCLRQGYDELRCFVERSRRRAAGQMNGLIKLTIPTQITNSVITSN